MDTILQDRCELLVNNRGIINKAFKWDSEIISIAASYVFTSFHRTADAEELKACEKILRKDTGAFSAFRGEIKVPLLCKMALSGDPEKYFTLVQETYQLLNKKKWLENSYKILAAMTICDYVAEENIAQYVDRTNEIYQKMKKEHPWLTSDEDMSFAAMLAVSNLDVEKLVDEMETCFQILKERWKFVDKNTLQTLSHVLALSEMPAEEKCQKLINIFDRLKQEKHKFGTGGELAVLGALAVLDLPEEIAVREIMEADAYLQQQKGFGNFGLGSAQRQMYAAQMVLDIHKPENAVGTGAILGSALAVTIALEVCMLLMMTAVTTTMIINQP